MTNLDKHSSRIKHLKTTSLTEESVELLQVLLPQAEEIWERLSDLADEDPGEKMIILSELFSAFAAEEKVERFNARSKSGMVSDFLKIKIENEEQENAFIQR